MSDTPSFDYARAQIRLIDDAIHDNDGIGEAIENALSWAGIAYDRLTDGEVPALYAASMIVGVLNASLVNRVLQPPEAAE